MAYYEADGLTLYQGDCREVMASLPECSVDAIVTDPPYELGFMGKGWDGSGVAYDVATWAAALRVLKPGGHMVAFGAPRNYHRMACAIEDADFEIRDSLMYLFGSGFPKSLQVNKNERFCHCEEAEPATKYYMRRLREADLSSAFDASNERQEDLLEGVSEQGLSAARRAQLPASEIRGGQPGMEGRSNVLQDARELHGGALCQGTGMGETDGEDGRLRDGAPDRDSGVVRTAPISDGSGEPQGSQPEQQRPRKSRTLADERRSQEGGVWPLCSRCGKPTLPPGIGTALKPAYEPIMLARKPIKGTVAANVQEYGTGGLNIDATRIGSVGGTANAGRGEEPGIVGFSKTLGGAYGEVVPGLGRWPANVLLDEAASRLLDAQSGEGASNQAELTSSPGAVYGAGEGLPSHTGVYGFNDRGGASRFFYTAKTSRAEREFALDDLDPARRSDGRDKDIENPRLRTNDRRNDHPTVKPVDLMRWLCRLITPPSGLILDPFLGSGSTGMAALDGGFRFIGIDLEEHYLDIAQRRIARRHLLDKLPDIETQDGKQGVMF